MRFFNLPILAIAFTMMSLSLAAPIPIPEPGDAAAPDAVACVFVCVDWKREE